MLRHPRVGVAEHFLDQPGVSRDAVGGGAVAVAEIVETDSVNSEARRGADEHPADGRRRERADRTRNFQVGQRFGGGRTEGNRPRAAALAGVDAERLRRAVPVGGPVAHQLAGAQPGEGQDATADLRG